MAELFAAGPYDGADGLGELLQVPGKNRGAAAVYLEFIKANVGDVPEQIVKDYGNKKLLLVDSTIYGVVAATRSTTKLFETSDAKKVGMRNIANRRLQKGQTLCVTKIRLTAALVYKDGSTRADDDSILMSGNFAPINSPQLIPTVIGKASDNIVATFQESDSIAGITVSGVTLAPDASDPLQNLQSGELTVRVGGKSLIQGMPLTNFNWQPGQHGKPGEYTLDNAVFIPDDVDVEFIIDFGNEPTLDGDESCIALRGELIGSGTVVG